MNRTEYAAMYRVEDSLWWYTGMRRISEALLDGRMQPGMDILDAGCGTGGNMRWLSRYGRVWGIDLSPEAMHFCRQRRLDTVSRASVLALPFPDRSFDLVTSFDVIYHLDVASDVGALREVHRVLRPGGTALVRVPAMEQLRSEHDAAVHTRQRYSLSELCEKARAAGFDVVRASYGNTLLFPLAAVSRRLGRRAPAADEGGPRAGDAASGTTAGTEHRSDVRPVAPLVNTLFGAVMEAEATLMSRMSFPIGLSALVVIERPVAGMSGAQRMMKT